MLEGWNKGKKIKTKQKAQWTKQDKTKTKQINENNKNLKNSLAVRSKYLRSLIRSYRCK